ncbi:MAG: cysteine desulfurase family protein [bacterium]
MERVYFDYSATTPLDPSVAEAMQPYLLQYFGNPSSIHAYGREARVLLEEQREAIARLLGIETQELFFTSGGTEADNHALKGIVAANRKNGKTHLIVSSIEHHAVLHTVESLSAEGCEIDVLHVDSFGMVNPDDIRKLIKNTTGLISVMHSNNEIGMIQPVNDVVAVAKEYGIPVHSDTVQTVGKVPLNLHELCIDLAAVSAHKFFGPKGIGAIVIKTGTRINSFLEGGSQESNRRAGTENLCAAVGFARALERSVKTQEQDVRHVEHLRLLMENRLRAEYPGVLINGHPQMRLPHILSVSFPSTIYTLDGEAIIMGMDLEGVAVTSGSACTSGSLLPSHVLHAMGYDTLTARATIRFSLSRMTTVEEVEYALNALQRVIQRQLSLKTA